MFDEFFIIFTDYTGEVERTVKKEERDKDPILFGVVHHPDKTNMPTNRMYFIADWVDEYCDLTLEELCMQYEGDMKRGILHTNEIPTTLEDLKKVFETIDEEETIKSVETIEATRGTVEDEPKPKAKAKSKSTTTKSKTTKPQSTKTVKK